MAVTKGERMLEVIGQCLNFMCFQVTIENAVRRFDINISMENFYAGVLNTVLGWNLINCNLFEKNTASIDLSDKNACVAVQVTSTDTPGKINETIRIFNEKEYYNNYEALYMYILTAKVKHKKDYDPGHNVKFKIWDATDMMAEIEKLSPIRQKNLYEYLKENIPQIVALFENGDPVAAEESKIQFDRTEMAFWMNPYAADDEKWFEDHYQIALADYLITMERNGLYLLIDLFEKDLAYTLNYHAKELGVLQQWTEQEKVDTGKVLYFNMEDKASIGKIVSEVGKWKHAEEPYQLLINFSVRNDMEVFRVVMRVAREIREKWPSVVLEILTLVNPYKLDFTQMDSPNTKRLEQPPEDSVKMWNRSSYIYMLLHNNICTFPDLIKVWMKSSDDKKHDLIEFASHSRTATEMMLKEIAPDELERLLSDDQLLYQNVKWDEIIINLIKRNKSSDCMTPDFLEWLSQKGSDECKAFLRSKQPITQEDWNELICRANPNDYEQYMNEIQYLGKAERLKLLYGCTYGEKKRAMIIADQQLLSSYRQMLVRKDMDTEYLFPRFVGGSER